MLVALMIVWQVRLRNVVQVQLQRMFKELQRKFDAKDPEQLAKMYVAADLRCSAKVCRLGKQCEIRQFKHDSRQCLC